MDESFGVIGLPPAPIPTANPSGTAAVPANASLTRVAVQTGTGAEARPVEVASLNPEMPLPRAMPDDSDDTSDLVATNNSRADEPTWQIQIAAAESEAGAIKMLKKAKAAHGSALRGTVPVTEEVDSGGQTLYRARFAGFSTKSKAWGACKTLKRSKFACYAIYQ